jgi:hypothetical protein
MDFAYLISLSPVDWLPIIDSWEKAGFLPDPASSYGWGITRTLIDDDALLTERWHLGISYSSANVSASLRLDLDLKGGVKRRRAYPPSLKVAAEVEVLITELPDFSLSLAAKAEYGPPDIPAAFPPLVLSGALTSAQGASRVARVALPLKIREAYEKAWVGFLAPLHPSDRHEDLFMSGDDSYED